MQCNSILDRETETDREKRHTHRDRQTRAEKEIKPCIVMLHSYLF